MVTFYLTKTGNRSKSLLQKNAEISKIRRALVLKGK